MDPRGPFFGFDDDTADFLLFHQLTHVPDGRLRVGRYEFHPWTRDVFDWHWLAPPLWDVVVVNNLHPI
jgi:hypothetical protein